MRRTFFILLLAGLVAFGFYRYFRLARRTAAPAAAYTPAQGPRLDLKDVQVLAALDGEYSRLISAVVPSVVSITSSRVVRLPDNRRIDPFDFFFPNRRQRAPEEREQSSLGSGVVVSQEGHILTNQHVIAGMEKIEVQLTDGRREPARLLGADEQTDIAVLKIEARNLAPLPFGDSDRVAVGQIVFAIGNPFGLQATVTQGIVSAKGRHAVIDSGVEFLQTDAAVNQGNSGGPLLNIRGEIVGLNSAIYSNSEAGNWLGISFAIPSNTARRALESLLKNGRVVRGYLGVQMTDVSQEIARQLGLPDAAGAAVLAVVADSPAARAGLQPQDVIRSFDDRPVADILALRGQVAEAAMGQKVKLGVWRRGQMLTLEAEVAEAPADLSFATPPQSTPAPKAANATYAVSQGVLAGIEVVETARGGGLAAPATVPGVVIRRIAPAAAAAGPLEVGDVITEVGHRPVQDVTAFASALSAISGNQKLLLQVYRRGSPRYVVVP